MRVLFLTLYPEAAASPRYRVGQFLPYLRAQGMECTVRAPLSEAAWRRHTGMDRQGRAFWYHVHETPRRIGQLLTAHRYDVVFVQKALMSAYLIGMSGVLRACAPRYVFDIDDAVHLVPPHPLRGPWLYLEDRHQVHKVMAGAALVLAGNSWLAEEARASGAHSVLFPTVVDTDRFRPGNSPGAYRIGWIGSPSTTPSLEALTDVLIDLPAAEVRLVGADAGRLTKLKHAVAPWHFDREVEEIQLFSVGLLPQAKEAWTRGKCALKALLYMSCGVPCVSTPFGAALDIIEHGKNGFFADSAEEWRGALELLRDPVLRGRMGEAARATVEARYSLRVAAPQLHGYLETVQ